MSPSHSSSLSTEYFEQVAEEPGRYKAFCLPLHYGTLEVLMEFVCKHWQRGFIVVVKTISQANTIESNLFRYFQIDLYKSISSNIQDSILVLHGGIDKERLQEYLSNPELILQSSPIVITTYERLLLEPPDFFLSMRDCTTQGHIT